MFSVSKAFFHALAESKGMKAAASRYGLATSNRFIRRFVAGDSLADAIAAAHALEAIGLSHTLEHLGSAVTSMAEADRATRDYITLIDGIAAAGIGRNMSIELTRLGLTVDRATCVDNLRRVLDAAPNFFVCVGMEDSRYTQVTLDIFETIWQQGYRNAGIVLQSYLPRSVADATRMIALGARVRLVKGAYNEPRGVAYGAKAEVDQAFVDIMQLLLVDGVAPGIATHDPAMIEATQAFAVRRGIPPERYELLMLYGIRRDLQSTLAAAGYAVRVYVPFGPEWFSYCLRRLGERPANLSFVVRSLIEERAGPRTA